MANKTISIGFKVEDGQNGFQKLTMSATELRNVMRGTVAQAESMKSNLIDLGKVSLGVDAITNATGQLMGSIQSLVSAYTMQIEAETKLATVMRERMAATDAEIQGIKDLCAAQQQLGVIGDEVQLAGAQQISTFLTSKTALETLIPAMNNLVAQQKGMNATQGDAVVIGNLLGKAMQGQTSALRRVGITFTEAERQAVEFGTEEQRAAALAQIITNNVGEMNAALAATPAGQMKQLSNNVSDLQEKFGAMAKEILPGVQLVNQLSMLTGSFIKLSMGLNSIPGRFRNIVTSIRTTDVQLKLLGTTFTATSALTRTFAMVFKAAMVTVKTALIGTGVGAAIWLAGEGLAKLVGWLNGVKDAAESTADSIDSMTESQNLEADALKNAQAQLATHIASLESFNGTKQQEKKLVEEMNNTYGETMGYFSSVSDWYKTLKANSEAYTRQIVLEARARMLANKIAAVEEEKYNLTHNPDGSKKPETPRPPLKAAGNGNWNIPQGNTLTDGLKEHLNTKSDNLRKELNEIFEDIGKIRMPVTGSSSPASGKPGNTTARSRTEAPEGSIQWHEGKISELESRVKLTTDPDSIMNFTREIEQHKHKISELKIWVNIVNSGDRMREIEAELTPHPVKIKIDVDKSEISTALKDIPAQFKTSRVQAGKLSDDVATVAEFGRQAASAFTALGDSMAVPALNVAAIIAGAIANIMAGFAAASAKEGAQGASPWEWIAFAVSGLATAVAAVAQVKQVTAFADGGIVSGPTMALVGEYAGARNNPEVIAPLDKLRSILGSPEGSEIARVEVYGRLRGSDIELCRRNYNRVRRASGHGG